MTLSKFKPQNESKLDFSDKDFLHMATMVVLDNVADESFALGRLVEKLNISRTHFFRKIKFLTGQNPSGFIRTIRLKYALHLLERNDYSIKEIAHLSGFSSHVYFTRTFRELFGITPQNYQKKTFIPKDLILSDMENLIGMEARENTSS